MLENSSGNQVLALTPSFSEVLRASEALGRVFAMARNEGCIVGGLGEPMRFVKIGRQATAWTGEMSLSFSNRQSPIVLAYQERGEQGAIDGIEFFNKLGRGFFKISRPPEEATEEWSDRISRLTCNEVSREVFRRFRRTNHLESGACCEACRRQMERFVAVRPPVEDVKVAVEAFVEDAVRDGRSLEVRVPCGLLRARLGFTPVALEWKGAWLFVMSQISACHLRVTPGTFAMLSEKAAGVRTLDLFHGDGRFVARIVSRFKFHPHQ